MEEGTKAAFNSAMTYTQTEITGIRIALHQSRIQKNLSYRYDLLASYFLALSARMDSKKKKGHEFSQLEKHKMLFQQGTKYIETYNDAKAKSLNKIPRKVLSFFDVWELELRREENSLGLLMMDRDNPYQAMSGGF